MRSNPPPKHRFEPALWHFEGVNVQPHCALEQEHAHNKHLANARWSPHEHIEPYCVRVLMCMCADSDEHGGPDR